MTTTPPRLLPWLRLGLSTAITQVAVKGLAPHDSATAAIAVTLTSTGDDVETVDQVSGPPVRLLGPADVVAIDPAQVVRQDPEPGAADAEPNYFAHVELAAPDLPWRYTPAAPDPGGRLQPWLALVVVEERTGVRLEDRGPALRPVLHVDSARAELPDLAQCWAWAHMQAEHELADGVPAALAEAPELFRARLLCPRRMVAGRAWLACLVPTFEAGRRAALGLGGGTDLGPAWQPASLDVQLPVYHFWRFRTGERGDFESLVRRLRPRELPATVGRRDLDIGSPGGGLPSSPGTLVTYSGALVSPAAGERVWPAGHRTATKQALRRALNSSQATAASPTPYDALRDDPVVGPPGYAARQAKRKRVPEPDTPPVWFEQLNTEPHRRAVAGLGAQVVRADQEAMVAAAWQYAAEQVEANRMLTQARLGWELAAKAQPKFATLDDTTLLQIAGPALSRLPSPAGGTMLGAVAATALPAGLLSGAFRRVTRVTTALARTDAVLASALADPVAFTAAWTAVRAPVGADLQVNDDPVGAAPVGGGVLSGGSAAAATRRPVPAARRRPTAAGRAVVVQPQGGPVDSIAADVRGALDPLASIAAMVATLVTGLPAGGPDVPDRIWVRPRFTTPMYERLRALSVEYLVPGIGDVPDNTLGLLRTNRVFIEAFLAGLNSELGREFAWREYPTRPSATWCQQFFDSGPDGPPDITVIGAWDAAAGLGANTPGGTPAADLVLLIKGGLPRRYPDLRVYAVEAQWVDGKRREATAGQVRFPVFAGQLSRDAHFYGFALTERAARGSTEEPNHPGWFFVLEERPRAIRFGLDVPRTAARGVAPARWSGLSWANLVAAEDELPTFVDTDGPQWLIDAGALRGNGGPDSWGEDSAAMARITLQRPVRMLTHADAMLPPAAPVLGPGPFHDLPWPPGGGPGPMPGSGAGAPPESRGSHPGRST